MTILPRLLALLAFAIPATPAFAVSEADLLPVDQAFALTASAPSRDRIEVQWKVADGYYLYRHRTDVQVDGPGFQAGKLQLPKGKAYRDEFFGDVETYHQDLTGVLAGQAAPGVESVTLKVKYQGCADAGICYPPQTRKLVVKLPAAGAIAGPTGPLGATNAGGLPRFGQAATAPSGAAEALPLPQEQAFAFEAIAYDGNQLLLRFTPAPGYYVYRDRTTMKLEGAKHLALGRPRWPQGQSHRDEHFGEVIVYFDQAEVPVPLQRSSGEAADATLKVTFQGCQKDGICYPPMTRAVKLAIPKGHITSAADLSATDGNTIPTPTLPLKGREQETTASESSPSRGGLGGDGVALEVPRTTPPADVLRKAGKSTSVWVALLLALAGGLVLNLMPCVLPVLSLKALSLADSGRDGGHARASALWYTAGVLLSFIAIGAIALALRAAGQALGWGFQLQQPLVIGALVYLMFAVGLSLSGVFALGHRFAGAGHELTGRSGPAGDFFTGVLAVVIASPCTAPFMGAALAFAFTASTPVALLVFAFLGLGLALPFLLIGFVPGLAQRLPKPGAWMETLKHFLAFPMYLTAVWLLWVLGKQRGVDAIGLALAGLVLLALGLWWYQRLRLQVAPLRRALALLVLLASLAPLVLVHRLRPEPVNAATANSDFVPYSAAKLAALRAEGRVVFVDMTADWCVTCKANEKAVLGREDFRASMQQADAVFMQGDWTNVDPAITQFLEAHQAVGVPLYVVFPSDGGEGEVLPTVLTQEVVAKALARAKR
ncbi:protein-disulfide reductase DsbD [Pseudoxanthomonas sp. CF125]|uniref:protein-disulfide reductase DsbD family protein n=1 Tax=Pseudoxanthomonas sp. CF125 TaxID=1855303 RepID=UPI0008823F64|nr:protein-disulfide reductase DsbD [Pseudoxanthomonas sp. CF125]SDQ83066.1 thiol:disulfide interchange protein DsbD [Pseudoxanthomonas sp. CF125]